MKRQLATCFLACGLNVAGAQSLTNFADEFLHARAEGVSTFLFDIDNDSLLLNRDDGFYTSGVRLGQTYTLRRSGSVAMMGWRVGQELYTPSDIKLLPSQITPEDHPYAGWLYGGIFKETHGIDGTHAIFGLDLGCLGPCAGGEGSQKALHRLINQPEPRGWSTQVGNEFGVVLHADVAPLRWALSERVDLTPTVGGRFGNIHTDVNVGLKLRAGRLNLLPGDATLHGFVRVNARAVAYDATLQGGYFSDDGPRTVQPQRLVGEAEAGVAWQYENYGLHASVVRRGNEIRDLPESTGAQSFVRLQFIYTP